MLEEEFKVRFHEMAHDHSVPIWILQNYFQQAAAADAENLSYGIEELSSKGTAWALINIKFQVYGRIEGVQNMNVKTWHCFSDKIYSRRDLIIYDGAGAQKVQGTSSWVIIDLEKRKIARTPQAMLNQKLDPIEGMEPAALKAPSFEGKTPLTSVTVKTRLEDIDVNKHVNNIHFTAWAFESVPQRIRESMSLKEISVNYKTEAVAGESITVKTYDGSDNSFWHIITRDSDGKELSAAYTVWE